MDDDEIINEVRLIRRKIEEECDNDFHKIFERTRRTQDRPINELIEELELKVRNEIVVA